MINLLSQETKRELAAARRNVLLLSYVFMVLFLGALITASYAVGYYILSTQGTTYRDTLAQYAPEKAKYQSTITEATAYTTNLTIAKSIFDNEFSFSDFTIMMAKLLPPHAILDSLKVTSKEFGKPIEIAIHTQSYQDSITVKTAFQSSPYFKDTKLRSVAMDASDDAKYQYRVIIQTTFDRSAFTKARKEGTL